MALGRAEGGEGEDLHAPSSSHPRRDWPNLLPGQRIETEAVAVAGSYEEAEEAAFSDHGLRGPPYDFQDLVAVSLRGDGVSRVLAR